MSTSAETPSSRNKVFVSVRRGRSYLEPINGILPPPPSIFKKDNQESLFEITDGDVESLKNKHGYVMSDCRDLIRDAQLRLLPVPVGFKDMATLVKQKAFLNKLINDEQSRAIGKSVPPPRYKNKVRRFQKKRVSFWLPLGSLRKYSSIHPEPPHGVTREMARYQRYQTTKHGRAFRADMKKNQVINERLNFSKSAQRAKVTREKELVERMSLEDGHVLEEARRIMAQDKKKQQEKIKKRMQNFTAILAKHKAERDRMDSGYSAVSM